MKYIVGIVVVTALIFAFFAGVRVGRGSGENVQELSAALSSCQITNSNLKNKVTSLLRDKEILSRAIDFVFCSISSLKSLTYYGFYFYL